MLTNTSWQPEGTPALACMTSLSPGGFESRQFGRRVESDEQWTVYHVFTGVPASVSGHELSGLSRATATASMLWLNHREQIQEKWKPVFRPDLRQNKTLERFHDSKNRETAIGNRRGSASTHAPGPGKLSCSAPGEQA